MTRRRLLIVAIVLALIINILIIGFIYQLTREQEVEDFEGAPPTSVPLPEFATREGTETP